MFVKVETLDNFVGVVQSRDHRKPECSGYGENSRVTLLRINLLAETQDPDYCGVFVNQDNDEFSVAVAVRLHRTLELAGDKFYLITCGKAGFQNTRNETSLVNLELMDGENKVQHVVYGQDYILKAHFSQPDGKIGMKVKRCFSFSDTNNTVQLVDNNGCPIKDIMSEFRYSRLSGTAEATLYSMFKFPNSNRVHFQCDILVCRGLCPSTRCDEDSVIGSVSNSLEADPTSSTTTIEEAEGKKGRSLAVSSPTPTLPASSSSPPQADALLQTPVDGAVMASYSVFVVEPGQEVDALALCSNCSEWKSNLLFYLCIAFGILFLVMLIVNLYLCCAMATPTKIHGDGERKSSNSTSEATSSTMHPNGPLRKDHKPEEFDPYAHARSWHGSQYGSRYSLNGGVGLKAVPVPFMSADNTRSQVTRGLHSSNNHHHQLNGVLLSPSSSHPNGLATAGQSRPNSRNGVLRQHRSRSRSKSRQRSRSNRAAAAAGGTAGVGGQEQTSSNPSGSNGSGSGQSDSNPYSSNNGSTSRLVGTRF